MSWRHDDAIARASIPGGLDKILQARFSSSTWKFLSLQYEDYKFIVDTRAAARSGEKKKHSQQYQE